MLLKRFIQIFAIFGILGFGIPGSYAEDFDHVVIDAGHGGKDPGSEAYGVKEKDLTLDLAKKLEQVLNTKGIKTTLTRRTDVWVDHTVRGEMANKPKTIFVCLHFNAHTDRSISGIETFYYPGSEPSRKLATYVQGEMARRLSTRDRKIKPEIFKVLEVTKGTAVLIECGFITNRWECQRCSADWFRQVLAEEIAQGILRYRSSK